MSNLIVYKVGNLLGIQDRWYSASDMLDLCNDARNRGLIAAFEINDVVTSLTALMRELLMLAAYAEPHKFRTLIVQLAQNEAGAPTIEALAGELLKRLDIVGTTYERIAANKLGDADGGIVRNTFLIHGALLDARYDDGDALRSAQIQEILGTSVKWTPPIPVGRPEGISPVTEWLGKQIIHLRQRKVSWRQVGLTIFEEINRKQPSDLSYEENEAFRKLKEYVRVANDNEGKQYYYVPPGSVDNLKGFLRRTKERAETPK